MHLSIIGGEPLLRLDEMDTLLSCLVTTDIEVQFVTSAVRPIPAAWAKLSNLHLVVSVDGLPKEHDLRRAPATYARILDHIVGHKIIVHCVILRSMLERSDYIRQFAEFWAGRKETKKIWFSLYTPQQDEKSKERLTSEERSSAIDSIVRASRNLPVVYASRALLAGYRRPPSFPEECIFAQTTTCIAPDLKTIITPCQLGGRPLCSECGCIASAGLASIGRVKLAGLIKVSHIFKLSLRIGNRLRSRE